MDFISVFLIAVGLAMDAFAVAICNGMSIKVLKPRHAVIFGIYFGGFQFIMPVIGYYVGSVFSEYIKAYDHWIAFGLLVVIGGKMFMESFKDEELQEAYDEHKIMSFRNLSMLAIATSIDAMAVGVSLAVTGADIFFSASVIGIVAFIFSFAGVFLGKKVGGLFRKNAERMGGVVLIGIGIKILVEHLFLQ